MNPASSTDSFSLSFCKNLCFLDEGSDGQAAEDGVVRGQVQEPQRDSEEVNAAGSQSGVINVYIQSLKAL